MNYWLLKSEPTVYSIEDLKRDSKTLWDGVRNYQARNFLKSMAIGDRAFFYHSNTKPPGIVGLAEISQINQVDPTQFDPQSHYYDGQSDPENPRWYTVEVAFLERFSPGLSLDQLKASYSPEELLVVRKGNRLSVLPVAESIAERLLEQLRLP
ncbi:MAG: EVE domain-containing protein [Prochlorotrichaceae cyanobacterium]|jgi:predicted RNA-binding protein with PUA-like domain